MSRSIDRLNEQEFDAYTDDMAQMASDLVEKIIVFCGGEVDRMKLFGMTEFKCPKCGALVSFVRREKLKSATDAWNRRADNAKSTQN